MKDDIPVSEKSKEEAKRRKPPKAVDEASKKVKKRVESEKPGPETEHVGTMPDTDPQH